MNIIDFLGILLPGAFLFMLIGGELELWSVLGAYWGDAESVGAGVRGTLLLIGGYVIGSLLHEAGDLLEHILWSRAVFDPRSYAARQVTLCRNVLFNSKPDCKRRMMFLPCAFPLGIIWYGVFPMNIEFCCIFAIFAAAFIVMWLGEKTLHNILFKDLDGLDWVRNSDAFFLAYPAQEDYKIRKRMLFDGFRAMSRNMFIALTVLKVYTHINTTGPISGLFAAVWGNTTCLIVFFCIQVLLFVRYYHYSYLKFKYCYEDYLSGTKK